MALNGAELGLAWATPFAGLLLSIAVMPLAAPAVWHHHFGKIAAAWTAALLLPFTLAFGAAATGGMLAHTLIEEYLPFTVLLGALYTTAGGIYIRGNLQGSPTLNAGLMALGAVLASFMGTTGASMLLIRPLIRANDNRRHKAHVVVFFIFIVSNVGGALTPLGDPPLFLGFLQGVSFLWTAQHLWAPTLFLLAALLALFWAIDAWTYRREGVIRSDPGPDAPRPGLEGGINLLPLTAAVGLVLMSGTWKPGIVLDLWGTPLPLPALVRDLGLLAVIAASLWLTPAGVREKNRFSWAPMEEVGKLFIAIFLTMVPVHAGRISGFSGVGGRAPVSAAIRLSAASSAMARRVGSVALAIWGVSTTFERVSSAGFTRGSPSKTSRPAAARRPSRRAAASASSSTMPPRAMFTSVAVGFIKASSAEPMQ